MKVTSNTDYLGCGEDENGNPIINPHKTTTVELHSTEVDSLLSDLLVVNLSKASEPTRT